MYDVCRFWCFHVYSSFFNHSSFFIIILDVKKEQFGQKTVWTQVRGAMKMWTSLFSLKLFNFCHYRLSQIQASVLIDICSIGFIHSFIFRKCFKCPENTGHEVGILFPLEGKSLHSLYFLMGKREIMYVIKFNSSVWTNIIFSHF